MMSYLLFNVKTKLHYYVDVDSVTEVKLKGAYYTLY